MGDESNKSTTHNVDECRFALMIVEVRIAPEKRMSQTLLVIEGLFV